MGEIKYQTQLLQNDSADVKPQYKNLYKTHFLCGNYTERRSRRSLTKTVASLGTGFTVAFILFRWRNFRWAFIVIKVAKGNERWGTGELIAGAQANLSREHVMTVSADCWRLAQHEAWSYIRVLWIRSMASSSSSFWSGTKRYSDTYPAVCL